MAETSTVPNGTSALGLGYWTAEQVRSMANLSHYAPSTKDLLLVGPRLGVKLGSFLLGLPVTLDDAWGGGVFRQRYIPDATESSSGGPMITGAAAAFAQVAADIPVDTIEEGHGLTSRLSLEGGRSFGNIFSYSTSRWALACLIMAILLNRTQVYAATRRSLVLGWKLRFVLRVLPILLCTVQTRTLLQSIHCQTSPDFSLMRWGNASKSSDYMFAHHDRTLHTISAALLFGPPDETSCLAVQMIPVPDVEDDVPDIRGSLSRLWPLFQTFCFSQFVEVLSCTLQGRVAASETGMTIFEHSLGFAEAEATVSSSLGWGPFGEKKPPLAELAERKGIPEHHINRSMILNRVNVPPEVLLVGALSSLNHLTSHVLAIFNLQGRLRLLNTAFWGICFMSFIIANMFTFRLDNLANQALLRFPTVCIIGFVPHVMVLGGILICGTIYGLAIMLTALASPAGILHTDSLLSRIVSAHENMQASITFSNIRINMHMDFYQALLKTGYNALTMASEAVYLNESSDIVVKKRTWLEEERLTELEAAQPAWLAPTFWDSSLADVDDVGLVPMQDQERNSSRLRNGYARERIPLKPSKLKSEKPLRDGVGATERSGRWIMVFEYFMNIIKLITSWTAALTLKALVRIGSTRRPSWLVTLARGTKGPVGDRPIKETSAPDTVQFWILGDDGRLTLPPNDVVDVEQEMKRRLQGASTQWDHDDEQNLGSQLYDWWLKGGWWGSEDNSGQYVPSKYDDDDDTTSIISTTSDGSSHDWDEYDESDGRRTPTQENHSTWKGETATNDTLLSMTDLAALLHPKTAEQRIEAQALAAHLASDSIITRSKFQEMRQRERLQVLLPSRKIAKSTRFSGDRLTPEQEAEILESLILARRAASTMISVDTSTSSWAQGASGLGDGGPQCVVCQSAPRSIIVWPCRCLSLCDDCRVSLAMNNFDKCVCCRRDVGSFSRIFVP